MNDALKKEFREYVLDLEKSGVDIDAGAFLSAMAEPPCVSVKINRRKCSRFRSRPCCLCRSLSRLCSCLCCFLCSFCGLL